VLVQERKLVGVSFPPWWNDVIRDALMLMQEGKITQASFP
jgi:hypothetical protein